MAKGFFSRKRSIVFAWLVSYAAVLLVLVIITASTYVFTVKALENEINKSNSFLLTRIQQQMDGLLGDVEGLSQEITFGQRINDLLQLNSEIDDLNYYGIYEIVRDLRTYETPSSSIDNFYIFFKNLDYIVSTYASLDRESFYEIYVKETGIGYDRWNSIISGLYKGEYLTMTENPNGDHSGKTIAYITTIPLSQSRTSANIVITLNEARFLEDARGIEMINEGTVIILDNKNNIMASSGSMEGLEALKYDDFGQQSGLLYEKISGKNVVISYTSSLKNSWKYIIIVPESLFWERAENVRRISFASLGFCFLLGCIITYFSLKKNYNPVSRLVKLLEGFQGLHFDKRNNEYYFIQQAIDKARIDKAKTDRLLLQQNKALRSEFLARLLKGRESWKIPAQEKLFMHDIEFRSEYFSVMVFFIEDYDFISFDNDSGNKEESIENSKIVQFIITNIVEELVNQKNQGFVFEVDDMMACLINYNEDGSGDGKSEMTWVASEAQKFLEQYYKVHISVSASNIHKTMAGIQEAYNEALQAMEYKKTLGVEGILHFTDIKTLKTGDYYYPLELEQQLINCIKAGDFEIASMILHEVFEKNFEVSVPSARIAKCLMFNLISTMIKTINEINSDGRNDFLESANPVERLLGCDNINEMKTEMNGILSQFCNYIKDRNKSRNKNLEQDLMRKAANYIHENYTDGNMAITTIAEYFNVHPVYLSKVFREQSGEGLLDYINRLRIKKAKQIFKEQQLSNMDDVSKIVGYTNTKTFTRAFKRYEGITPGKFKDLE